MKVKILMAGALLGAAGAAWGILTQGGAGLGAEVWIHEGDTDGDGLRDAFEIRQGLDPNKVESFADGIPDEHRLDASGKTMFEIQEAEQDAASAGGDGSGGGRCGLLGAEILIVAAAGRGLVRRGRASRS